MQAALLKNGNPDIFFSRRAARPARIPHLLCAQAVVGLYCRDFRDNLPGRKLRQRICLSRRGRRRACLAVRRRS